MNDNMTKDPVKAYFLGPQSENEAFVRAEIQSILDHWFGWRKGLFADDPAAISRQDRVGASYLKARENLAQHLDTLNDLLADEIPKYSPRYLGHMVSELALPAIFGHFAALLHNPNNISKEASRVGTHLEKETVAMLATMVGYNAGEAQGHITGGGTIANFEAIWRARFRQDHWLSLALYLAREKQVILDFYEAAHMGWPRFYELVEAHEVDFVRLPHYSAVAGNPYRVGAWMSQTFGFDYRGPVILVPQNKHYSWSKGVSIFGVGEESFWPIPLDASGVLDPENLTPLFARAELEKRPVMMVVSVAGTTETGRIDPVNEVATFLNDLREARGLDVWHHVDAAYGGFMCSLLSEGEECSALTEGGRQALAAVGMAHSITIDPHKLGYTPYSCGAILTRDAESYTISSFEAPYLERQETEREKWSTTLEGSRSAAGVAATWLTGKTLGFDAHGIGAVISNSIEARRDFETAIRQACPSVHPLPGEDTNILCFSLADEGNSLSGANRRTSAAYDCFSDCPDFAVSKTTLHTETYARAITAHVAVYGGTQDVDELILLRCVFMNPFWAVAEIRDHLTAELVAILQRL